ncbi:MAG: hypothetical protein ABI193_10010 [Minicystis sp.]
MTFTIEWDFPARAAFDRIPWPKSADVAALIHRFSRDRAPFLDSGAYPIRGAGYRFAVRVDRSERTVLVLYLQPL